MAKKKEGLPKHLASQLPLKTRKALQHPRRRQILRALGGEEQKLSPSELTRAGEVAGSLACTSHHIRSLKNSGLVKEAGREEVRGAMKHYFSSSIGDDGLIQAALRATEKVDQRLLARTSA